MSARVCLDCGDKIRGRSDKKFCSDQCRNNYNNRQNREINQYVRNIHSLLRKNRKILSDLYDAGKMRVHKDALLVSGYSFGFFTHVVEPENGPVFWYCYEYGFSEPEDEYIKLVKNESIIDL